MWNENNNCCMRFGLKSNLYRDIFCPYTFSASLKRIGLKLRSPDTVGLTIFHQFKGHNSGVPKAIWHWLILKFILCPYTLSPIVSIYIFENPILILCQYKDPDNSWISSVTSSSVRLQPVLAPMLFSSCAREVAPITTEHTRGFCSSHRSATWATDLSGNQFTFTVIVFYILYLRTFTLQFSTFIDMG